MEELRVVITADASAVPAGVAQATAAVQASADQIAAAQAKLTASTEVLTAVQKMNTGATMQAGSGWAAAAAAVAADQAALDALTTSLSATTAAQEANTAATVVNTVAQERDTAVTYSRMEAMGAARIAMGAMDGSTGMMAGGLARLAGASALLGPLLQELVPYAVLAAGADIIFHLGESAHEAYEKFLDIHAVDEKLLDDFGKMQQTDLFNVHDLETVTARLDLATKNATTLREEAQKLHDQSLGNISFGILPDPAGLLRAKELADASGKGTEDAVKLGPEQLKQEHEITLAKIDAEHATDSLLGKEAQINAKLAERLAIIKENQEYQHNVQRSMGNVSPSNAGSQMAAIQGQQARGEAAAAMPAAILESLQESLQQQEALQGKSSLLEYTFWEKQLETFVKGSSEYLEVLRSFNTAKAELMKQFTGQGETTKAMNEWLRQQTQEAASAAAGLTKIKELEGELAAPPKEAAAGNMQAKLQALDAEHQKLLDNLSLRRAEQQESFSSKVDPSLKEKMANQSQIAAMDQAQFAIEASYIQKKKEATQEGYAAEVKAARDAAAQEEDTRRKATADQLEMLDKQYDLASKDFREQARITADETAVARKADQEQLQAQIKLRDETLRLKQQEAQQMNRLNMEEERNFAESRQKMLTDEQKNRQQLQQEMEKVASTFNSDFERAFNSWATKSKTAGQAFGQMLGQMELQVVDFVAKWVLQQAEKWAITKALDLLGFGEQKTTQSGVNAAEATSNAAVAATGAAAAVAFIPIVGPALAVTTASSTMGAMAPFIAAAAFDTGGMLPHMGYAFNSSGSPERVLSPSQTQNFESMVNNGGSSSRSAVLHQTNHFGGGVTPEMLQAHTNQTMSRLRAMIRPEAFR